MQIPPFASEFEISPEFDINQIPIPKSPEQAAESIEKLAAATRRSFLGRGAVAAAAAPVALLAAGSIAKAATKPSPYPSLYPGSTLKTFQQIQLDEANHVNYLIAAIRYLGGTPRPYPTFTGLNVANASQFLQLSVAFENTGVHAYFGAAPFFSSPGVAGFATSIAFVEAYHSGFLNSLANAPLLPGGLSYATPFTIPQVVTAVQPYIVSLNDNGLFPATFSTTPSPQNDIAILNFALLLEYLEATFYYFSVGQVFAGTA